MDKDNRDIVTGVIGSYSKSKVANEKFINANQFNYEIIVFRNATVFGYSRNLRLDLVINDLCYEAFTKSEINLLSDGTPKRPFIHVLDLANIINEFLISNKNRCKSFLNSQFKFQVSRVVNTDLLVYYIVMHYHICEHNYSTAKSKMSTHPWQYI